jgi:putative aldouronate transport system substrate-binding protein
MSRRILLTVSTALVATLAFWSQGAAETVHIRMVEKDFVSSNPDDVRHLKRIEDALREQGTDIDIQLVDLPSSGYADKLSAMLLSGDIPDLIYFQGGDAKMVEQGLLEDLNPLIDATTYLKKALWPQNVARLKNYPYLLYPFPVRSAQPVIRKDWLEKTGLKPPQTVDDYVTLFKAIRDGDLDGDGKKDTFAVTAVANTDELDSIFNRAFGVTGRWMQDESKAWVSSRITSQEKSKIGFYASLREQGLLDPEYVTTKFDVKEDKFYTGKVGVVFATSAENIDVYTGKMRQVHPGTELVLLDPPKGEAGQGLAAVDVSKESRGFAIATTSKHRDEIMKLLDFMASPEGQMMDRMGFEGEQYTKENGAFKTTGKITTWYARFMAASDWVPPVVWQSEAAQQSLATARKYFKPDNAFVWPADYASDLDATENVYRSWVYRFISGQAKMDQWDQFVSEWKAAGGDRLNEYARTQLDAKQ